MQYVEVHVIHLAKLVGASSASATLLLRSMFDDGYQILVEMPSYSR
jgi:hypothetical protein